MIIRKMTATFGALDGATLELKDGLNILSGANEAGKSTWSAFIRVMLYGLDLSERDSQEKLADKNKYAPWSGAQMFGRMEVEHRGRVIVLERSTVRTRPMSDFYAYDKESGSEIRDFDGTSVGEYLTGVSREVFDRTFFVGASLIAVTNHAELERRIGAMVTTGDERSSLVDALKRLGDLKNKIHYGARGLIPEINEKRRKLAENIESATKFTAEYNDLKKRADDAADKLHMAKQALIDLEAHDAGVRLAHIRGIKRAVDDAQYALDNERANITPALSAEDAERLEHLRRSVTDGAEALLVSKKAQLDLKEEAENARAELVRFPQFDGMDSTQAAQKAETDAKKLDLACASDAELAKIGTKKSLVTFILGMAISLAIAVAVVMIELIPLPAMVLAAVPALVSVVISRVIACKYKKRRTEVAGGADELLASYNAKAGADFAVSAEEFKAVCRKIEECDYRFETLESDLKRREAENESLRAEAMELIHRVKPDAEDFSEAGAILDEANKQNERLISAQRFLELQTAKLNGALGGVKYEELESVAAKGNAGAEVTASKEDLELKCNFFTDQYNVISRRASEARARVLVLGSVDQMQQEDAELAEELKKAERRYRAIDEAMQLLARAGDRLRSRFAPGISKKAGEIMAGLTKNRYKSVELMEKFEIRLAENADARAITTKSLSTGTAAQLYLSVRLAMCEMLAKIECAPIVLDDALIAFDDERCKDALQYLSEFSSHKQVLLFTCHGREGRLAPENAGLQML